MVYKKIKLFAAIATITLYGQAQESEGRYTVTTTNLNSTYSDFAPSYYKEGLLFSSARDTGLISRNLTEIGNQGFSNLYQANGEDGTFNTEKLSKKLNTKAHESSAVITKDGNTMYFTRNNFDKKINRDKNGISRLQLYKASLVDGQWKNIKKLPFNSNEYSAAHPALNADESKLYFASDMPGTLGESDIFYVTIDANGNFGTPQNLGATVNTAGRDTFPFLSNEDILYFASDGHPGLGGLDIFATNSEKGEPYSSIINLGEPINTKEDDFSFIINSERNKGYFTSNRPGGVGNDDIYAFEVLEELAFEFEIILDGTVKNLENGNVLPNTTVEIQNTDGSILASANADKTGYFNIPFKSTLTELKTIVTLDGYEIGGETFMPNKDGVSIEFLLEPSKNMVVKGQDVSKYLNMPMIYFDYDKANIRPDAKLELDKIVAFMNEYPEVKIEIGSHTDSRGNDDYNLTLSEKRAQATRNYIIDMGINASRLSAKGYGETQLTNDCGNHIKNVNDCDNSQHEQNRRSEFIFIKQTF